MVRTPECLTELISQSQSVGIVTIGCHVLSGYVRIRVTNIEIVGPTVSSLNQKVVVQHENVTYLSRCFHICGYAVVKHSPAPFRNTESVLNNDTR